MSDARERMRSVFILLAKGDHSMGAEMMDALDAYLEERAESQREWTDEEIMDEAASERASRDATPTPAIEPAPPPAPASGTEDARRWDFVAEARKAAVEIAPHNPDATLYGILANEIDRLRARSPEGGRPASVQACPVCGGRGSVPFDFYGRIESSSAAPLPIVCRACNGAMVFFVVPLGASEGGERE